METKEARAWEDLTPQQREFAISMLDALSAGTLARAALHSKTGDAQKTQDAYDHAEALFAAAVKLGLGR